MDFKEFYNNLPEFIILVGIPGSGKSTWISKINSSNKYIVVSPDDIRREITGNISDQSQNSEVWSVAKEKVINALNKGYDVILDSTMTDSQRRKEFIEGLPPAHLKAKIFHIDPEIAKKRIKKDLELGKNRSEVPDDAIDKKQDELMNSINKLEDEGFEII